LRRLSASFLSFDITLSTHVAIKMRISIFASAGAIIAVANALTLPTSESPYAPISALCPSESLVRPASGLNSDESAFIAARKAVADKALVAWLAKTDCGFATDGVTLPTVSSELIYKLTAFVMIYNALIPYI
jgi:hypothetical protein